MDIQAIQHVRSFNRTVAERVGALNDRFLDRDRPMPESRLLWEIGFSGAEIRELRKRLDLDSGYISRMLASLQKQGLVSVDVSPTDNRVRLARLTSAGMAERRELDQRSDELAMQFLEPLSNRQRTRLVDAMTEVESLLNASLVEIGVENPSSNDAQWCFTEYFSELDARFEFGLDPAETIVADSVDLRMPTGILLLARLRERVVGCGAFKLHPDGVAELTRIWISPDERRLGIGGRMLRALEVNAMSAGANVVRLETNRALPEALALYLHNGYQQVEPFNNERYADYWLEKHLAAENQPSG